jgi:predicted nucleic acid-binding Zn ribbon protein
MNCRLCGTPLPPGALFCVECGRSVAEREPVAAWNPAPASPREAAEAPDAALRGPHCPQCGSAIEVGDIFCGECGFVLRPIVEPLQTSVIPVLPSSPAGTSAAEPESDVESDPEPEPEPEPDPDPEPDPGPEQVAEPSHPLEDVEVTRVVASTSRGERYVLQFSTGESVVVTGSGLVGRNPAPEPGEYVDDLVAIFDVGKSVSKSHIEFGQEAGRFWVADRYSTNGTLVRQPGEAVLRCVPGRRYMVARGTRVEIGEQFFIVS